MTWKYERHRLIEVGAMSLFLTGVIIFITGRDTVAAVLRWPTEDVNQLLKDRVWQNYRNETNERKDRVSRMLEDSNYVQSKNNPTA